MIKRYRYVIKSNLIFKKIKKSKFKLKLANPPPPGATLLVQMLSIPPHLPHYPRGGGVGDTFDWDIVLSVVKNFNP